MFDLANDSLDFDYTQLSSPLAGGGELDDFMNGLPSFNNQNNNNVTCSSPSSASTTSNSSSCNSDMVFGSFLVDINSSTPYTDATQVNIKCNKTCMPTMIHLARPKVPPIAITILT